MDTAVWHINYISPVDFQVDRSTQFVGNCVEVETEADRIQEEVGGLHHITYDYV